MENIPEFFSQSYNFGSKLLSSYSKTNKKKNGQFLTPLHVAKYMACQLEDVGHNVYLLEPAIGSGILACAVIERLIKRGERAEIWIDGYEIDTNLANICRQVLDIACSYASRFGIKVNYKIFEEDFIISKFSELKNRGLHNSSEEYSHVIANPPYFKLRSTDKRVKLVNGFLPGHSNIYTLFMFLSAKLLTPEGKACFLVPRSFCSGAFFVKFRKDFISIVEPTNIHLFKNRAGLFDQEAVLQENIILSLLKRKPDLPHGNINITTSKGANDLSESSHHSIQFSEFIDLSSKSFFFRLPGNKLESRIIEVLGRWPGSFSKYGIKVSTGRVVPFRDNDLLIPLEEYKENAGVPLLWMHNISYFKVFWPVINGKNRPQAVDMEKARVRKMLLSTTKNYVLIRRFSSKEETNRLITTPLLSEQCNYSFFALENHINYIHKIEGNLKREEALGLSALLNTNLLDKYFRISNGNTQVNVLELNSLPLPPLHIISKIGLEVGKIQGQDLLSQTETLTLAILKQSSLLTDDLFDT